MDIPEPESCSGYAYEREDFTDEGSVVEKYVLDGSDFHAECTELSDGRVMFLGNTRISMNVPIDEAEARIPGRVDKERRSIAIGTIVDSFEEATRLICKSDIHPSWELSRTIV